MQQDQLTSLFQAEFERCKIKKGESAVVLSSERSRPEYAAASLSALRNLGANVFEIRAHTPAGYRDGMVGLTPISGNQIAIDALKAADFVVDLVFLLHSPEQSEILEAGTRVLLVLEPPDVLARLLPTDELRDVVEAGAEKLRRARTLRVTSAAGTDLEMQLGEYPTITQYGFTDEAGRWDHWPGSFLYTWPNEGQTNGRVVLSEGDFISTINMYVSNPIVLTIKDGYIRDISGGSDAQLLREQFESFNDPEAYAVSHIGWGVDPRADWNVSRVHPRSVGMDQRSFAGNVQFSTGPNVEVGGKRHTLAHFDMPMLGCTLLLDGQVVVENGRPVSG
jgi:2,5-dihydroxypyridine 5,6-dioxygenase